MVGTLPYQKRGKCGHWMPSFDKHLRCYSCRMHCKGEDPCASGAPLEACSSCSSLSEVEWNHLRTVFQERSAKKTQPELDSEGEPETGEIDDSILDLNTEEHTTPAGTTGYTSPTGVSAPTGLCLYSRLQLQVEYLLFNPPCHYHGLRFPGCPGFNFIQYNLFQDAGQSGQLANVCFSSRSTEACSSTDSSHTNASSTF